MRWIILSACMLFLNACVDVKIVSSIDKITYFNLYNPQSFENAKTCKKISKLAMFDIYANAPYDNSNIYIFNMQTLQVDTLFAKKWISSPKDMLKMALLLKAQEQCFELSTPPFGTQKIHKALKLSLLSLQILNDKGSYKAQVSVFYEIMDRKTHQNKSGMIESLVPLDSINDEYIALGFAKASDEILKQLLKVLEAYKG